MQTLALAREVVPVRSVLIHTSLVSTKRIRIMVKRIEYETKYAIGRQRLVQHLQQ